MLLSHRTSSSSAAALRGGSSSSRVRPVGPAANRSSARQQQRRLVASRAAEGEEQQPAAEAPEAGGDEAPEQPAIAADDFEFNYSDAKKGNQWQRSDVDAALSYYADEKFLGGGGSEMPYESEFVTNPLSAYANGPEDSSWLADVDNNEAYERDEYSLAGIPEAAPKVKRRDEEEEDNTEAMRALEDEKIGASAFDDVEGLEDDDDPNAVWNWALEEEADSAELATGAAAPGAASPVPLLAGVSELDIATHPDLTPEQKDAFAVLLDPFNEDAGLELVCEELPQPDELSGDAAAAATLSQAEEAEIAALLADDGSSEVDADAVLAEAAQLSDAVGAALEAAAAQADLAGAEDPLDAAAVQQYLTALRAFGASGESAGVDEGTVGALLGGETGEQVTDLGSLLSAELPKLPDGLTTLLQQQDAPLERMTPDPTTPEEAEAQEVLSLLDGIEALSAQVDDLSGGLGAEVDEFNEALVPSAEALREYEAFIDGALDYYEATGGVSEGAMEQRPQDAPINPYEDPDPELLGADAFGADEEDVFDARYGPQFQERILELGRVTKVVKGGKLMGFRCVAVVGDGKGRVGVGCQAGREVSTAVKRALVDAKKNLVVVPLVGAGTIPHRSEAWFKAAGVVLQPAADGTGVIAGGAVRAVLELAGVQNVLGKRLGSRSTLNNARVTLKALAALRTLDDYADARGLPLDMLIG